MKTFYWAIWYQNAKAQEQTLTVLSSCLRFSYSLCHAWCCCSSYFESKHQIFGVTQLEAVAAFFLQRTIECSNCCCWGFREMCDLCENTEALGVSGTFGTVEYAVEMYFSPQAVIPFAVKRKERCCKCFMSRESMMPVSSDVLFISLY